MSSIEMDPVRQRCGVCSKNVQYYCGECCVAVVEALKQPLVRLPLTLDVLRGVEEAGVKSTASHAPILASPVRMFKLGSEFPEYADARRVLLLYPSPTSVPVSALPDLSAYDSLAVVDTTWVKVGRVFQMPQLAAPFTHVHLGNYHTLFWRHQPLGPQCVSSIESVYFFFREWEIEVAKRALTAAGAPLPADLASLYDGRHDNLLLFFLQQYKRIQHEYASGGKGVSRHIASQLSSTAPQLSAARRVGAGGHGGGGAEGSVPNASTETGTGEEGSSTVDAHKAKRPRVKGAWSVAPSVLGGKSAPVAGDTSRQDYVSAHLLLRGEEAEGYRGGVDGRTAAAMQFEHIRVTNRHTYGMTYKADKGLAAQGVQAAAAIAAASRRGPPPPAAAVDAGREHATAEEPQATSS